MADPREIAAKLTKAQREALKGPRLLARCRHGTWMALVRRGLALPGSGDKLSPTGAAVAAALREAETP